LAISKKEFMSSYLEVPADKKEKGQQIMLTLLLKSS
jgi:hypothetical protein